MKKFSALAFCLWMGSMAPLTAESSKVIHVPPGTTHSGSVTAFKTYLHVEGRLENTVLLVGGTLRLQGTITGDVICLGSRVEIMDGAEIGRDLILIGGSLQRGAAGKIHGEFYFIRSKEDLKKIARTLLPFLPGSGDLIFFKIVKIFFWLILVMLTLVLRPVQIGQAADMLGRSLGRFAGYGLLTLLAFLLLLLCFIIMSLALIGIPLLFALLAAYFLVLIFGRTVVFYFLGGRMAARFGLQNNPILFVALGTAVYALLKFIPWLGVPLLVILDVFAIGIGVGYILQRRKKSLS